MNPEADTVLENLARLVQVIGRDKVLRERFGELARLSPTQRANEIHILAEQMAAEGKDPELVKVFRLFADPRVFRAGVDALRECG
jgi:hypothetical protein